VFTIAFTGHRPTKLGGYGESDIKTAILLALERELEKLQQKHIDIMCISGMALGFDQWAAEKCIAMNIPCIAAIPFEGQQLLWPDASIHKYRQLLQGMSHSVTVSPGGYSPAKMQIRNQWMIDNADLVLAAWDGSKGESGTKNCIEYARKMDVPIVNILNTLREHKC